jgi:hypothetical protein
MLPKPRYYPSPSLARMAVKAAVKRFTPGCDVNDVIVRVDPDEDQWFGIISLNTDDLSVLSLARKYLPEFRVIGEPTRVESRRASRSLPSAL